MQLHRRIEEGRQPSALSGSAKREHGVALSGTVLTFGLFGDLSLGGDVRPEANKCESQDRP